MDSSVTDLVIRAREGDAEAFGKLYGMYYKEMYCYACSVTGDSDAAQDAVSEAVVEAIKGLKNLKNPESFKGWMFKILNVSCRKQYNLRNSAIQFDTDIDTGESDDGGISKLELSMELKEALKVLSGEEREIVMMSVLNEYKSQEIADILGSSPVTIRSKLSRALKKLRTEMENSRKEAD